MVVGDLSSEPGYEIVGNAATGRTSQLSLIGANGEYIWQEPTDSDGGGTPALADINNDGSMEIISPERGSGLLVCHDSTGDRIWEFDVNEHPERTGDGIAYLESSPVVADINDDGVPEIIFGDSGDYKAPISSRTAHN